HKPTGGLVPCGGQYPLPAHGARNYITTGPLARRAEDLAPLLRILAGPEAVIGDPAEVDLKGLDVFTVETNGFRAPTRDLRDAQRKAASALAARGANVRPAKIEGLEHSLQIWSAMLDAAAGPSFS